MKYNPCVLCIGAAHIDYKFMPLGPLVKYTSNPISSDVNYGGVVRNVAENLSRLEIDVSLMSVVGDDLFGNQLIEEMRKLMNVAYVNRLNGKRTGQYYAALDTDGDMDIAYADMGIYDVMDAKWMLNQLNDITAYDYYIVDMNVQGSGLNVLIQWAKSQQKKLVIIGVSEPKMSYLPRDLDGVYLLICNQNEAKAYFQNPQMSESDLTQAWKYTGVENIIMTNGSKPIILLEKDKDECYKNVGKIPAVSFVDATGAGDAFSAGLMFGILSGESLSSALDYGVSNARLTIQSKNSVRQDLNKNKLIQEVKK